jgi:Xaa-Pro aminopeptidase
MNETQPYTDRLAELRAEMRQRGLAGLLVKRPENRRYLSGYTADDPQLDESSGWLLILEDCAYLLTDSRYETQARREAVGFEVVRYQHRVFGALTELCRPIESGRLGYEEDLVTVRELEWLKQSVDLEITEASGLVENRRAVKDDAEIECIIRALAIAEEALAEAIDAIRIGRTERETARRFEASILELGAEGPAFETIVASGPNAALPHAVPGDRKFEAGDAVVFDCGAVFQGYRSDITRTVLVEPIPDWIREIYQVVHSAQHAALEIIAPHMMTDEVDRTAREVIEAAGYGPYFGHGLGHGLGLATHERPSLSRFNPTTLRPGMVVTVEPGIYLPGKGGVRLEQLVLITIDGARVLNHNSFFYDFKTD